MAKKKVPEDIQKGLKKLADATKKNVKQLVDELKEIMKTDENIQVMEEHEAKVRFAWTILASRYSISDGDPFYFKPYATPRVRKTKNVVVGEVYGVAQQIKENENGEEELGDIFYTGGTFWRDAAKLLNKLQKNKVYRATFRTTKPKKENGEEDFGLVIGGNNPNFKETDDINLPNPEEFYEDEIIALDREIDINEMDINSKNHDVDIRTFRVTVLKADVREGSRGEYAYYDVVDDSILGHRTQRIFVEEEDLEHGPSSILHLIGTSENLENGSIRYTNHFIVPEYSIPLSAIAKPIQSKEAIDIDLENDEDEEPEEEETDETEDNEEEPESKPKPKKQKKKSKKPKKKEKSKEDDEESDDEGDVFSV